MAITVVGVPTNESNTVVDTGRYAAYITDLSGKQVKASKGKAAQLLISGVGTTWQIDVYDGADTSGHLIYSWVTADGKASIALQCPFLTGLYINSSGTTAGTAVVVFS